MKINSDIRIGGKVAFPENHGERVYMFPFFQQEGLPSHLARWQNTVDQLLAGVKTSNPIYLMVDQGVVIKGQSQRRPGLHVEGNWDNLVKSHPSHRQGIYATEMVILASDVYGGCRALLGEFDGELGNDGQCDRLDFSSAKEITFEPYKVYRGNVTMIHESLPLTTTMERTLVRLNLPGVSLCQ